MFFLRRRSAQLPDPLSLATAKLILKVLDHPLPKSNSAF